MRCWSITERRCACVNQSLINAVVLVTIRELFVERNMSVCHSVERWHGKANVYIFTSPGLM